ncbi:hypothetical protein C2S53_017605 [Perilla frutescens var. hirtella]|uniref:Uncharacterized protein n=1 Tax=Perilla frutescens var. hirtella TaxID=608512 RepID=A0AAD4J2X6_PERFH|nr:hypothetical protein C2S53_017605 [Perilla frutescens var. hirtella]
MMEMDGREAVGVGDVSCAGVGMATRTGEVGRWRWVVDLGGVGMARRSRGGGQSRWATDLGWGGSGNEKRWGWWAADLDISTPYSGSGDLCPLAKPPHLCKSADSPTLSSSPPFIFGAGFPYNKLPCSNPSFSAPNSPSFSQSHPNLTSANDTFNPAAPSSGKGWQPRSDFWWLRSEYRWRWGYRRTARVRGAVGGIAGYWGRFN